MDLSRFPRVRVAHLPTPVEPLDNLSAALGGPRIWIKRDDCTGLATGGNKTRKLEFLVADALEQGADTLITIGATQSNHVRQTAAIAGKFGMRCHILLENRAQSNDVNFNENGNVLLDRLYGAEITVHQRGSDMKAIAAELAERLRGEGRKPYVIPVGGSNPIGVLGYVDAALEADAQFKAMGVTIDQAIHATGSCGTQAGLVLGYAALGGTVPVLGVCVSQPKAVQETNVLALVRESEAALGLDLGVGPEAIHANSDYVGEGYGIPTEGMVEAVKLVARTEAILLDPVYSGKAMAGLIDLVRKGAFAQAQNILFWHTGGSAALFGYGAAFDLAP
jgi:L-cysteate sulfo-lyase